MAQVYVSVGSNIEREKNIRSAVGALRAAYGPLILSSVFESAAQDFDGDNFYNLVAGFRTSESPRAVAARLADIENRHGRVRQAKLASRTLDLDLLLYDDLVIHEPGLSLPRPEIEKYAFVLKPLAEIAPHACHPQTGRSYREIWGCFADRDQKLVRVTLDFPTE